MSPSLTRCLILEKFHLGIATDYKNLGPMSEGNIHAVRIDPLKQSRFLFLKAEKRFLILAVRLIMHESVKHEQIDGAIRKFFVEFLMD